MAGQVSTPDAGADPLLVEILADGRLVGSTLALPSPGAAPPCHLFEFILPRFLQDGDEHLLGLRVGGVRIRLENATHNLGAPPPKLPAAFLDTVSADAGVCGWAWYPLAPERRVELEILADNVVIGAVRAELFRPDLLAAGIGDGHYGYAWPLPPALSEHPGTLMITIRDKDSGTPLANPMTFTITQAAFLFQRAQALLQSEPEEAAKALLAVVELEPDHLQAHVDLARYARKQLRHETALRHFSQAARLAPADIWRGIDVAASLRELNRPDEAEAALQRVKPLAAAGSAEAMHVEIGLAKCAQQRGDPASALAHYAQAAAIAPQDIWRWLELADMQLSQNLPDAAEAALNQGLVHLPDHPLALAALARCKRVMGDHAAALDRARAAAKTAPEHVAPLLEMAASLQALGQRDEALAAYEAALKLEPNNIQAMLGCGGCHRARNDRTAARAMFSAAAQVAPANIHPPLELATLLRDEGDFAAARQIALDLRQTHPGSALVEMSLGHTAREAAQHEEARAHFAAACELAPDNVWALTALSAEDFQLRDFPACQQHLQAALALDPCNPEAIRQLAHQARVMGDIEAVRDIYQDAAIRRPSEPAFMIGLCDAKAAMGDISAALAGLNELTAKLGPLPQASIKRIALLRAAGDYEPALHAARAASAAWPGDFYVWLERFLTEILYPDPGSAQACIEAMPSTNQFQQGQRLRCMAMLAESQWQLEQAMALYEQAEKFIPEDHGLHGDLVRISLLTVNLAKARHHLHLYTQHQAANRQLRGESMNLSQSIYGQILDEYLLDQESAAALVTLTQQDPAARLPGLRSLFRVSPNNTSIAISLLVALRQSGGLAYRPPLTPEPDIPRIINKFWDSSEPPPDVVSLIEGWRRHNPDYEVRLFNNVTAHNWLQANMPQAVLQAFLRAPEPAQKADIFRLALLAREGGIYSDADDRAQAPVGRILPAAARLVLFQENLGSAGNNFIAAQPNHPVITTALIEAVNALNRGDADTIWLLSGPGLLTRALARAILSSPETQGLPPGIAILDLQALHLAVAEHCAASYKYKNKHWANGAFIRQHTALRAQASLRA